MIRSTIAHRVALRHRLAEDVRFTVNERIAMIHVLARQTLDELEGADDASEKTRARLRRIIELAVPVIDERRESAVFSTHESP